MTEVTSFLRHEIVTISRLLAYTPIGLFSTPFIHSLLVEVHRARVRAIQGSSL